jgi:hypothetical protein
MTVSSYTHNNKLQVLKGTFWTLKGQCHEESVSKSLLGEALGLLFLLIFYEFFRVHTLKKLPWTAYKFSRASGAKS